MNARILVAAMFAVCLVLFVNGCGDQGSSDTQEEVNFIKSPGSTGATDCTDSIDCASGPDGQTQEGDKKPGAMTEYPEPLTDNLEFWAQASQIGLAYRVTLLNDSEGEGVLGVGDSATIDLLGLEQMTMQVNRINSTWWYDVEMDFVFSGLFETEFPMDVPWGEYLFYWGTDPGRIPFEAGDSMIMGWLQAKEDSVEYFYNQNESIGYEFHAEGVATEEGETVEIYAPDYVRILVTVYGIGEGGKQYDVVVYDDYYPDEPFLEFSIQLPNSIIVVDMDFGEYW